MLETKGDDANALIIYSRYVKGRQLAPSEVKQFLYGIAEGDKSDNADFLAKHCQVIHFDWMSPSDQKMVDLMRKTMTSAPEEPKK